MTPGSSDRAPSSVDRVPVSRLGDELQQRVDAHPDPDTEEAEEVERDALDAARSKGWDKPVDNIDPPTGER